MGKGEARKRSLDLFPYFASRSTERAICLDELDFTRLVVLCRFVCDGHVDHIAISGICHNSLTILVHQHLFNFYHCFCLYFMRYPSVICTQQVVPPLFNTISVMHCVPGVTVFPRISTHALISAHPQGHNIKQNTPPPPSFILVFL